MNYKVIMNLERLANFVDWLPDLEDHETYYLCLFARKKYCRDIQYMKSDKCQMKRFTSNKSRMIDKIRQLECSIGTYVQKGGIVVPQQALALYISINPRSFERAAKNGIKELVDLITKPYSNYNPHQVMMSHIQKAHSRKVYFDLDFDNIHPLDVLDEVNKIINPDCLTVLMTRGGFHLLVRLDQIEEQYKKSWYNNLVKLGPDIKGDTLIPVPGCYQGGFCPHLLSIEDIKEST